MPLVVPQDHARRNLRRWVIAALAFGALVVPAQLPAAGASVPAVASSVADDTPTPTTEPACPPQPTVPTDNDAAPLAECPEPAPGPTVTTPMPSKDAPVPAKPTFTG